MKCFPSSSLYFSFSFSPFFSHFFFSLEFARLMLNHLLICLTVKTIDSASPAVLLSAASQKPLIALYAPSVRAANTPVLYLGLSNPTSGNPAVMAAVGGNVVLGLPSDIKSSSTKGGGGSGSTSAASATVANSGNMDGSSGVVAMGAMTCADVVGRVRSALQHYYSGHSYYTNDITREVLHGSPPPVIVDVKPAGASGVSTRL
jgi:hypothetical protein